MTEPGRSFDALVVGGGHNALVCAAFLAEGGLRTLVLEARDVLGGPAETRELWPGVRVPVGAHSVGRLSPTVARRLDLRAHGLALVSPAARVFAPEGDGGGVTLWADASRTAADIRARFGPDEASRYAAFDDQIRDLGRIVGELGELAPPDLKHPAAFDAMAGLRFAARARGFGRRTFQDLLRIGPAPVADVVGDALTAEPLRALVAWRGVRYGAVGVRGAGTALNLVRDSATTGAGLAGETAIARGGPGALVEALAAAARARGVEIRTGAAVARIRISDGARTDGVTLASGEAIDAPVVVAGVDPKRALLDLVDPAVLGPTLGWRVGNIRASGMVAKVHLALAGVPRFGLDADDDPRLRGRILLAPNLDAIERACDDAKYGVPSRTPVLEAMIPSLLDPSLVAADAARGIRHILSVLVQYAPYRLAGEVGAGGWDARREALGEVVLRRLEEASPGLTSLVLDRQVVTPLDLEREYGLTGGHPMHAETALDQFFAWRPMLGMARYRLPFEGLYLAGSGAHPGGGITGVPGANAAREIVTDWRRRRR